MRTCPKCGVSYPDSAQFCATDGTGLSPVRPDTKTDPRLGTLVDRYRLVAKLGEGGMGMVYRAEHTIIGRQVALKLLHPHLTTVPEAVDRFFREARAAGEMATENIVQITDSGRAEDGTNFLVMELLEGESIADVLGREQWLGPKRAAAIAIQIGKALQVAHAKGVIHRDLKPPNVQLLPGDNVKLLDFGVAKITESNTKLTQTGMIVGSPAYMSPEQASGKKVDHRTDVYAFGVILYEMLTGETPFTGTNATEILLAHVMNEPPSPRSKRADVPEELERLILDCLAKPPDDRPADMTIVTERLEAFHRSAPDDVGVPKPPATVEKKQIVTGGGAAAADPLGATFATPAAAVAAPDDPPAGTDATLPPLAAMTPTVATGSGAAQPGPAVQPAPTAQPVPTDATGQVPATRNRSVIVFGALGALVLGGGVAAAVLLFGGDRPSEPNDPEPKAAVTAAVDSHVAARPADSGATADTVVAVAKVVPVVKRRPRRRPGSKRKTTDDHGDETPTVPVPDKKDPEKSETKTDPEKKQPEKKLREFVVVRTTPSKAAVVRQGKLIGRTPLKIPVPRRQRLTISLPGHRQQTLNVGPTSPAEIKLQLKSIGDPQKSMSRLEHACRTGSIGRWQCIRRRQQLKQQRDVELFHAKQRWKSKQITWKQYQALSNRIYNSYR